ncbi:MAG: type I methionyl aminopeptidase [Clostridium sp.]|nr:type I methionyl aminopeptidase [Clostridium sp.]
MAIIIKSHREIELMKEAGRILAITHEEIRKIIKPGISTYDIDKLGADVIKSYGCVPSFLNYNGYPASICTSVNDEVVHGIPSRDRILQEGDIISLDAGVIYKGYHSDSARTYPVGKVSEKAERLMKVTKESFFEALKVCRDGNHVNDISRAVFDYITARGYSAVRDLVGHGVGANLHEAPEIPNFTRPRKGPKLRAGMTIAVEPMINVGTYEVEWLDDDWTVVTADGELSSHYENTILITEGDPIILSQAEGIEL